METYTQAKVNKIEDCLGKASIAKIKRETDKDTVIMFLRAIISKTSSYFNVSGNMNEDQIIETANDILDLFFFLSIEDFKFCFTKGKQLRYNKEIWRFDGSVILGWLGIYVEERAGISEQSNMNKHNDALSEFDNKKIAKKEFYDKFKATEDKTKFMDKDEYQKEKERQIKMMGKYLKKDKLD